MRRIAVVGASGFVGSTLVERLLTRGADEIVPFIHGSGNAMRVARLGVNMRPLDLLNSAEVDSALAGVTHVVNCSRGDDDVMTTGLRHLLAACRKHRVERVIHLSSVAVYGDPPSPESWREDGPAVPARGTYGWIKLQQDRMVTRACREGVPSLILCPPNISGPESVYLESLVDALRSNAFALLDDGAAPCNLVDVSNLCWAIELALGNGPADGSRMFVTDDEETTWRHVIDNLAALVPEAAPAPTISRAQLLRLGATNGAAAFSLSRSLKHLVSREMRLVLRKDPLWARIDGVVRHGVARMGKAVEDTLRLSVEGPASIAKVTRAPQLDTRLCRQQLRGVRHACDMAKARLGYTPPYSVAESMEAFRRWYRAMHGMDPDVWPLLRHLH
jgi:nucleoside-diphosphate-sugar epimerase